MIERISISAKCSDLCFVQLYDEEGNSVAVGEGYAPSFIGGGDYVELSIDIKTGKIIGWVPPTDEQLFEEIRKM